MVDLRGQTFDRLTVVGLAEVKKRRDARDVVIATRIFWRCSCSCGAEAVVEAAKLRSGHSRSCGCYQRQRAAEARTVHGDARGKGKQEHPIYTTWRAMWDRCTNPNHVGWQYYGALGVTVCERWRDYRCFREDMGPSWRLGLTIDRVYPFGDYEPSNCRWAT